MWAMVSGSGSTCHKHYHLQAGRLSPGVKCFFLYISGSCFTEGHILSGLSKPLRPKSFQLAVKAEAPGNSLFIISPSYHLLTHHGTVVPQWLCDPTSSMSHSRTSHCGARTNVTGEEEPAVGLMFSVQGFSPNPAKCCTLWGLSRFMHSHALMHMHTHAHTQKLMLSLDPLLKDSPIPAPLSIFPDLQTC